MSRSNPSEITPNPACRWFEWNGQNGNITYFDKTIGEKGEKVELPFNLQFLFLDELYTIKGWNDPSESGIYSNEVRDTRSDVFVVKSFKGGEIATGLYAQIRDKVIASGGHFTVNLYVAAKVDGELRICSLQFKGAALNAWIEFAGKKRKELETKSVQIVSVAEGKKGSIKFKVPVFEFKEASEETNKKAVELDVELQAYLKKYLAKNVTAQTESVSQEPTTVAVEEKEWKSPLDIPETPFPTSVTDDQDLPF